MKIGFWELVVIVVIAFVFIGPDQLPVYAKKLGKMLRELKKYTGAASEEIQKNVVEPLNEIQAPLKEAVAPLTDIKKDIDNSVKDVTKSFTGIGKTSKEEAAKAEQAEEVTELEEVEELPEETPAEAPAAEAPKAEEKPAFTASRTMPRQSPSDTTNKVSPLSHCFVFFRKVGIRNIPVIDQKTRKAMSFKMLSTISMPSKCLLTANVESNTMRTTAKRSSTTRIPKTTPAKR